MKSRSSFLPMFSEWRWHVKNVALSTVLGVATLLLLATTTSLVVAAVDVVSQQGGIENENSCGVASYSSEMGSIDSNDNDEVSCQNDMVRPQRHQHLHQHSQYSSQELQVGLDLGVAQDYLDTYNSDWNQQKQHEQEYRTKIEIRLQKARNYMEQEYIKSTTTRTTVTASETTTTTTTAPTLPKGALDLCRNMHTSCATWAVDGECDVNPGYMKINCGPVCFSCHYRLYEYRCPMNLDELELSNRWKPNDLDEMFINLTTTPITTQYHNLTILSSPDSVMEGQQTTSMDGPWIITLDNLITQEEANRFIEMGAIEGYERSTGGGPKRADGSYDNVVSEGRTSSHAFCQTSCYTNPTSKQVMKRLSNLVGIPESHSEHLQLLKYDVGQYYRPHHDYIPHHIHRKQGVRILTIYIYLNDVPQGGGTNFNLLNITVMPKVGRAVIWPSVLNEAPSTRDDRTSHQALPVIEGTKYGMNAWFHIRDFKTPYYESCHE